VNPWPRRVAWTLAAAAIVYEMIVTDVVLRARHAYLEGEKYWRWSEQPRERELYLQSERSRKMIDLDKRLSQGKLTKHDYERHRELVEFDYRQALRGSTIQSAYIWYQTAVDQFSPPESKWVKLARSKIPLAKARWLAELKSKNIPYEAYMVD